MSVAAAHVRRAQQIVTEGLPIGPRMYPCVCRAGLHAHAGATHTGACKATKCKRYRPDRAWVLAYDALDAQHRKLGTSLRMADRLEREQHYRDNPRREGEWSIGASDAGTCPRAIQYRNAPPEDFVRDWEDKREADSGTMLHDQITVRMRRLYPWRKFGGKVLIPGLDRESEYDSYDPITCELEDYKTAGDWKWDQIGQYGPAEETWDQVMLYAYALIAAGFPVLTVRLSYYKRANGHDEHFVRDYDEQQAKAALNRLLGYATALDLGHDLPRTGTGPTNDPLCRRCFARSHCWNIDRAEALGRSPESLTILGAEPTDPAVIFAIKQRVNAQTARLDAEKAEKESKTLLDGVEPGRYGDYEGYERGGSSPPDWKGHVDVIRQLVDVTEPERVMEALDALPDPPNRKYRFMVWSKVRKATLEREEKERRANAPKPTKGE